MRHLIIEGPGGRGKTFFATQILLGLNVVKQSLWLDCGEKGTFAEKLGTLMANALPAGPLRTTFLELYEPVRSESSGTPAMRLDSDLEVFIREHLLSDKLPPLYLVLDDADRIDEALQAAEKAAAEAEEANTPVDPVNAIHWLIERFAGDRSCLRIIATIRVQAVADRLHGLLRKQTALLGRTKEELKPFSPQDVREYFKAYPIIGSSLEPAEYDLLVEHIPGEPLILSQMAKQINGKPTDQRREWLHKVINICQQETNYEERRTRMLYEVFEEQFERLITDAQRVVLAVAMLNELSNEPAAEGLTASALTCTDAEFSALIAECLHWNHSERVSNALKELVERRILHSNTYRFFYDTGLEFALKKFSNDRDAGLIRERTAKAMEDRNRQDLATWHRLQIPGLSNTALIEAFHFYMNHFSSLMIRDLRPMMRRLCSEFRVRLWKEGSGDWEDDSLMQSVDWYVNLSRYAEVIYYGYNISDLAAESLESSVPIPEQSLWKLVKLSLAGLEEKNSFHDPRDRIFVLVQDAYVRCLLLRAVLVFEQEVPDEDEYAKYQKPRDNRWLAEQMETIIGLMAGEGSELRGYNPPFIAMVQNFRGCYYNGGGRKAVRDNETETFLDKAIIAFAESAKELDDYEQCLPAQVDALTEMHRRGFVRDRLDIANNWSRSRFLLYGPAAAIDAGEDKPDVQRFRKLVDEKQGTHGDALEYSYCLVDLCFYLFAMQDLKAMEAYLNRAYLHKSVVKEKRKNGIAFLLVLPDATSAPPAKRQYDKWVEAGIDVLEVMHYASTHSMQSDNHASDVKGAFLFCRDQFRGFGYSRDACMAEVDSVLVDIWATKDRTIWKKKVVEVVTTLVARGANDEPIAVGLVNYLKARISGVPSGRMNDRDEDELIGMIALIVRECFAEKDAVQLASDVRDVLLMPIDEAEVAATVRRFPNLIGSESHTDEHSYWRPPFIMRGALFMVPVVRAPQPIEFPELNYSPC